MAYPAAVAAMLTVLTLLLSRRLHLPAKLEPPPAPPRSERIVNWTIEIGAAGTPTPSFGRSAFGLIRAWWMETRRAEFVEGDDPEFRRMGWPGWRKVWPDFERREAEHFASRSAVDWPGEIDVPVLLLHSRSDSRVTASGMVRMTFPDIVVTRLVNTRPSGSSP